MKLHQYSRIILINDHERIILSRIFISKATTTSALKVHKFLAKQQDKENHNVGNRFTLKEKNWP